MVTWQTQRSPNLFYLFGSGHCFHAPSQKTRDALSWGNNIFSFFSLCWKEKMQLSFLLACFLSPAACWRTRRAMEWEFNLTHATISHWIKEKNHLNCTPQAVLLSCKILYCSLMLVNNTGKYWHSLGKTIEVEKHGS